MPLRVLPLAKTTMVSMHSILMREKICILKVGKKAEQQAFAGKGWIMLRIGICRRG